MDDVTAAAVAIGLYVILLFTVWILPALTAMLGGFVGSLFDKSVWDDSGESIGIGVGAIVGWICALGLTVLAVVNGIIQIVRLVQLLT